jgi:hypothetical protein
MGRQFKLLLAVFSAEFCQCSPAFCEGGELFLCCHNFFFLFVFCLFNILLIKIFVVPLQRFESQKYADRCGADLI